MPSADSTLVLSLCNGTTGAQRLLSYCTARASRRWTYRCTSTA